MQHAKKIINEGYPTIMDIAKHPVLSRICKTKAGRISLIGGAFILVDGIMTLLGGAIGTIFDKTIDKVSAKAANKQAENKAEKATSAEK